MPKYGDKSEKPMVLSREPSANWKRFLSGTGMKKKGKSLAEKKMIAELNLIDGEEESSQKLLRRLPKAVAIDCEMVGVASPMRDMLARVSIVDMDGNCVYDKFVLPTQKVIDYRTWVSGIRPHDLQKGEPFDVVKAEVAALLKNKIVVGHAVGHDFDVLRLKHPKYLVRDTSTFPVFRKMFNGKTPSLRNLARVILGVNIQCGEHSSVQDAKATIQLYVVYRKEWEAYVKEKHMKARRNRSH